MNRVHHVFKSGDEFWDIAANPQHFSLSRELPSARSGDYIAFRYLDEDGNVGRFWFTVLVFFDAFTYPIVQRSGVPGFNTFGVVSECPPETLSTEIPE